MSIVNGPERARRRGCAGGCRCSVWLAAALEGVPGKRSRVSPRPAGIAGERLQPSWECWNRRAQPGLSPGSRQFCRAGCGSKSVLGNVARCLIQWDGDLKVLCLYGTGLKMLSFSISDECNLHN